MSTETRPTGSAPGRAFLLALLVGAAVCALSLVVALRLPRGERSGLEWDWILSLSSTAIALVSWQALTTRRGSATVARTLMFGLGLLVVLAIQVFWWCSYIGAQG